MLWCYLRYNLGLIRRFEDLKAHGAHVFAGRDPDADRARLLELYTDRLQSGIFPEARRLVAQAMEAGMFVAIISSTYRFMVAPFAAEFGVEDFFGCDLEVTDGVCTGRLTGKVYHQRHKADCVRTLATDHGVSLPHSYAFGDSTNDLPMLEAVGRPVVVNPGRRLRGIASERDWRVEAWASPR